MRGTKRTVGWVAAALISAFAVGCGGPITYTIKGTPKSPEVDGTVVADPRKDSDMTILKVNLDHLAPPGRLGSGSHFVIWAKNEKGKWKRVGALKYDEGKRHASLEDASVPQTSFDFMITVEKDVDVDSPSSDPLYTQHIN